MKFDTARASQCANLFVGDAASTPELVERVRAAVVQMSESQLRDLPQAVSTDTDADTNAPVFRFYVSASIPLELDDDEDEWKAPLALPMHIDVPLYHAASGPTAPMACDSATGAPAGEDTSRQMETLPFDGFNGVVANASQQLTVRALPTPAPRVAPERSGESPRHEQPVEKVSHSSAKSARVRSHGPGLVQRPVRRASQIDEAELQADVAAMHEHHVAELGTGSERGRHHTGARDEATENWHATEEKVHTPVVGARVPMHSLAATPMPMDHDAPQERPQPRTVRQQIKAASQAPVEPTSVESGNGSETYEVTYRFTSWGADAAVKLNLDGAQFGRSIVATPSDSRVHNALRAGMDKKSTDAGKKTTAMPIHLASPLALAPSDSAQERQRRGKPQVPFEEQES
ncbi:SpaN/EivJ family type III secretion system needle length determinant [Ralstonia mojiangensis]|uniref:SpaN/EivJ family type III secretion system needle length determinant n=1 Tax=Ralstonia mojiangensis TaxID=2953895 RepID=UPI0021B47E2A|nr:hypothetical protein [Ralstonia mojiangensis]MCT7328828.1 hypothetical protein [Ralstonia mojiangensis]